MTEQEALDDLKARVRELMTDAVEHAMAKLDTLVTSGSGVVQDHIDMTRDRGPWVTPRNFVVAYCDDLKWQHSPIKPNQTRAWKRTIKNYSMLM